MVICHDSWFTLLFVSLQRLRVNFYTYIRIYFCTKHTVNQNMPNISLIYAHIYNRTVVCFEKCNAFKFTVFNIEKNLSNLCWTILQFDFFVGIRAHTHTHPQSFVTKSQSSLNEKRANFLYKSILFRSIDGQNGL